MQASRHDGITREVDLKFGRMVFFLFLFPQVYAVASTFDRLPTPTAVLQAEWRAPIRTVATDPAWQAYARSLQKRYRQFGFGPRVRVLSIEALSEAILRRGPVVIMVQPGSLSDGRDGVSSHAPPADWVARLKDILSHDVRLPFSLSDKAIQPGELTYTLLPNPWNPKYPIHLYLGTPSDASTDLQPIGHFERRAGRLRTVVGFYRVENHQWVPDRTRIWQWDRAQQHTIEPGVQVSLHSLKMSETAWHILRRIIRTARRQSETVVPNASPPSLVIHLYPFNEDKVLFTGDVRAAHCSIRAMSIVHTGVKAGIGQSGKGKISRVTMSESIGRLPDKRAVIHAIWAPFVDFQAELTAVLTACDLIQRLGRPVRPWIANAVADALTLMHMPDLLKMIHHSVRVLLNDPDLQEKTLEQLLADPSLSSMWRRLIAAVWMNRTLDTHGMSIVLRIWSDGNETMLKAVTGRSLRAMLKGFGFSKGKRQRRWTYLKGATLAHTGYRILNGYLSRRASREIDRMHRLGFNAVAVIPYTFMRRPDRPAPLPVPAFPGGEHDLAVRHVIVAAQRRGMVVMLKPQIWLHGAWPGDIRMADPSATRRFLRSYRRWILHYAFLAERTGTDLLALGTELRHLTRGDPQAWRALIQDIRAIYHGDITYAANWSEEFEHLSFWDAFDFIGVNGYGTLSQEKHPSDESLQVGARRMMERIRRVAERFQRPVILTEWGYPSRPRPWYRPYDDHRGQTDDEAQARCFQAVFPVLVENRDILHGFFIWKWPTDTVGGRAMRHAFSPVGRPAEDVIRRWLRKIE